MIIRSKDGASIAFSIWLGGIGWLWRGVWICFRPPWSTPLYSERYGHVRMYWRLAGFRIFSRGA